MFKNSFHHSVVPLPQEGGKKVNAVALETERNGIHGFHMKKSTVVY
jgi:hypothetical protein